jgi:ubiquilin
MYSSLFNALANGPPGAGSGSAAAAAAAASQNPFASLFNPPNRPGTTSTGNTNQNETNTRAQGQPSLPTSLPPLFGPNHPFLQSPNSINQLLAALINPHNNPNEPPSTNPAENNNPLAFLFPGGLGDVGGTAAAPPPPPADNRPPEERYEQQLRQLNEMGFYEFERNVEALRRSGGSVNGAVEYLLTH